MHSFTILFICCTGDIFAHGAVYEVNCYDFVCQNKIVQKLKLDTFTLNVSSFLATENQ